MGEAAVTPALAHHVARTEAADKTCCQAWESSEYMATKTRTTRRLGPADLGLDLGRGTDVPAFRWLVACELFGARIRQEIAARAYAELHHLGVLTPTKLAQADWQTLVDALGRGGYRRYDESTARELIKLGRQVQDVYGGHLTRIRREVESRRDLTDKLQQFPGIGPTAAAIFVRELGPLWLS